MVRTPASGLSAFRNTVAAPLELGVVQHAVESAGPHQLLMRPGLDDAPVTDDEYDVGVPDGGEPVGDDE